MGGQAFWEGGGLPDLMPTSDPQGSMRQRDQVPWAQQWCSRQDAAMRGEHGGKTAGLGTRSSSQPWHLLDAQPWTSGSASGSVMWHPQALPHGAPGQRDPGRAGSGAVLPAAAALRSSLS